MAFFLKFIAVLAVLALAQSFPTTTDLKYVSAGGRREMMERGDLYQGDILLNPKELHLIRQGLKDKGRRWNNGVIVYEINGSFSDEDRDKIRQAQELISSRTCVTFKERTDEEDYVSVENGDSGCYSALGRTGGKQTLNLGNGCVYKGIPAHEYMHALGFFHEQARTDRDDYVTIEWENIEQGNWGQFEKNNEDDVDSYGVGYDYGSIMHYPKYAFSKNGEPTIIPKQDAEIGQIDALSDNDATAINNMYDNCN